MNSDITAAQLLINAAMQALKKGDRRTARRYAEKASALAPQIEQSWLLLAFLASPKAAQYYLDRALQMNPTSHRALAGKEWLKKQSIQSAQFAGSNLPVSLGLPERRQPKSTISHMMRYSVWLVVLVALLAGLAAMGSRARQAESQDTALVRVVQTALKAGPTMVSSLTSSLTWTASPTETPTTAPTTTSTTSPFPTNTATPIPTSTSTPTSKPTATLLPSPTQLKNTPVRNTYSVVPGDTLNSIAQSYKVTIQSLLAANNIANPSLIRAGQILNIPASGLPPAASQPTAAPIHAGTGSQGKEIQIDISEQHLYAYQDNEMVFSLVVSTGIGNSTRIGTFKVLDKIPKAYSNAFNIWMPYWMGIYYSGSLENGIHGLPLLMNGVELWGNLLGSPATYGCIESKTSEAKRLYDWAEIGTPVIIRK
ncbi:MAG TPA: L,D-transpeptidase family protein [Anaerolineaceae bacterium]